LRVCTHQFCFGSQCAGVSEPVNTGSPATSGAPFTTSVMLPVVTLTLGTSTLPLSVGVVVVVDSVALIAAGED
jgi:hypothetical protein